MHQFRMFKDWLEVNYRRRLSATEFYTEMSLELDYLGDALNELDLTVMSQDDIDNTLKWFQLAIDDFKEITFSDYVKQREVRLQRAWR